MKRVALAGAAGLLAALPGIVQAQSSVTLYGIIDAGLAYTNNQRGASNVQATSGKLNGSRWGLKASKIWAAATRRCLRSRAAIASTTAHSLKADANSGGKLMWAWRRRASAR